MVDRLARILGAVLGLSVLALGAASCFFLAVKLVEAAI